ncbi:MAG: hypothetical protein H7836_13035 [Magnetococcus sp. YQC-3]
MQDHKVEFSDKLRNALRQVYTQILETGDAKSFEKGIVKGMMISARTLNLFSVEELTELVNIERKNVFGTHDIPVPSSLKDKKLDEEVWYGIHEKNLGKKTLEEYLAIPTFIRNNVKLKKLE